MSFTGVSGKLIPKDPTPGERIVTSSRSHSTGLIDQVIKSCEPTKILAVGGAGHKVILLMEGQAHCYVMASPGKTSLSYFFEIRVLSGCSEPLEPVLTVPLRT